MEETAHGPTKSLVSGRRGGGQVRGRYFPLAKASFEFLFSFIKKSNFAYSPLFDVSRRFNCAAILVL